MFKHIKIRSYEIGLLFRDREFQRLLEPGRYWLFDPWGKLSVDVVSQRDPWLLHEKLDMIVRSGALKDRAIVLDLKDYRARAGLDRRPVQPRAAAGPVRLLDRPARRAGRSGRRPNGARSSTRTCAVIAARPASSACWSSATVEPHHMGVLFVDGQFVETLPPGRYAFWKNMAEVKFVQEDLREAMLDIAGQEIMTADKVTLRMNAVVTYRVVDARQAVSTVDDARQALYREAQLALRAVVGARELDTFLVDKDARGSRAGGAASPARRASLGLEIVSVGVRDIILPGDMKELMNKVTEAKKAAEANLIVRREETAAMRARPTRPSCWRATRRLMRLRELEVLEKIASAGKLNIVLGEKGLADRVVNLL